MSNHTGCHHLLSTLSDYIDGDLSAELCAELDQHLEGCSNCRVVVNTLKKTVELYKEEDGPDDLPGDVRYRLFQCLELGDFQSK
jgi:anti-sigma factor RsiW